MIGWGQGRAWTVPEGHPWLSLTWETFVSVALDRERPGKSQLSLKTRDWMELVCKVRLYPLKLALSNICSKRWIYLEMGRRSWRQPRGGTLPPSYLCSPNPNPCVSHVPHPSLRTPT